MNCEMALTTSTRMGGPRRAAKFRTVSCERRTAKFLSGPASLRNVAEFMTTRRSKRYDFKAGEGAAAKVSQQRRCQAFILHYCCSCLANSVSLLRSRSAAYAEDNRLMIEGSRCKRRPISLTLALHHSRARYTNIDLVLTHFR